MSSLTEIAQEVSGGKLGSKPHALSSVVLLSVLNLCVAWKKYRNDLIIPRAVGILYLPTPPSPLTSLNTENTYENTHGLQPPCLLGAEPQPELTGCY